MTWDDTLANGAQTWADYLAQNNSFKHASGIQPGENLYLSGSPLPEEPCTEATQLFYGEIKDYDFDKPGFSMKHLRWPEPPAKTSRSKGPRPAI